MGNLFNAAEVMDMGIEKEKKRRDFYGLVAGNFNDKEMKGLFTNLRDWEEEHIKKFTEIKKSVKEPEATDSYPGELSDYIKSLVDDRLYKEVSPDSFSKNVKTPLSAVQYGIGFEKDAILFFREILPFMDAHKDAVQKLINEEKRHVVYLTELKKRLER